MSPSQKAMNNFTTTKGTLPTDERVTHPLEESVQHPLSCSAQGLSLILVLDFFSQSCWCMCFSQGGHVRGLPRRFGFWKGADLPCMLDFTAL